MDWIVRGVGLYPAIICVYLEYFIAGIFVKKARPFLGGLSSGTNNVRIFDL